jgi:hypothetical protein
MALKLVKIGELFGDSYINYLYEVESHFKLIISALEENEASAVYSNVEITTDLPEEDIKSNFIELCEHVLFPLFNEEQHALKVSKISRQENYVINFKIVWKKYLDC